MQYTTIVQELAGLQYTTIVQELAGLQYTAIVQELRTNPNNSICFTLYYYTKISNLTIQERASIARRFRSSPLIIGAPSLETRPVKKSAASMGGLI